MDTTSNFIGIPIFYQSSMNLSATKGMHWEQHLFTRYLGLEYSEDETWKPNHVEVRLSREFDDNHYI